MNKLISILLALTLLVSLAVPAMAAESGITAPGTKDTTLTATVTGGYTVTIPASINLTTSGRVMSGEGEVVVAAGMLLDVGKTLTISVAPANNDTAFELVSGEGDTASKVTYTIKNGQSDVTSGNAFFTSTSGYSESEQKTTLTFTSSAAERAGTYTDTVTFTVACS